MFDEKIQFIATWGYNFMYTLKPTKGNMASKP